MTVRVYFTNYADDQFAIELLHQLLDQHWPRIEAAKSAQSADQMTAIVAEIINIKLLSQVAIIAQSHQNQQAEVLRLVSLLFIANAVFAEGLRRWLTTDGLDLAFIDAHGKIIDRQMQFYELTGTKACFFALLHLCLGSLCEERDNELKAGMPQRHAIASKNPEAGLSLLDIVTPVFEKLHRSVNAEPEMSEKLRHVGRQLLLSSETLMWLSGQQQS